MQSMHDDSKTDSEKDLLISQLRNENEYYKNAYEKLLNGIITKTFPYLDTAFYFFKQNSKILTIFSLPQLTKLASMCT